MMFGPGLWGGQSNARIIINPTSRPPGSTAIDDSTGNFDVSGGVDSVAYLTGGAVVSNGATSANGKNTYKPNSGRLVFASRRAGDQARVGEFTNTQVDGLGSGSAASATLKFKWMPGSSWANSSRITFIDSREHGFTGTPDKIVSGGFWFRFETATQEFVLSRRSGVELCRFSHSVGSSYSSFVDVAIYFSNIPYFETKWHNPSGSDFSLTIGVRVAINGVTRFTSSSVNYFSTYVYSYPSGSPFPDVSFNECILRSPGAVQLFNTSGSAWEDESYLIENITGHFFGVGIWDFETEELSYTPDNYPWS